MTNYSLITSFQNLFAVASEKYVIVLHEIDQNLPDQLAHVHTADHFLKDLKNYVLTVECVKIELSFSDLLSRVDAHVVHVPVPLCADEIELAVVAEGAPLRVDQHVLLVDKIFLKMKSKSSVNIHKSKMPRSRVGFLFGGHCTWLMVWMSLTSSK